MGHPLDSIRYCREPFSSNGKRRLADLGDLRLVGQTPIDHPWVLIRLLLGYHREYLECNRLDLLNFLYLGYLVALASIAPLGFFELLVWLNSILHFKLRALPEQLLLRYLCLAIDPLDLPLGTWYRSIHILLANHDSVDHHYNYYCGHLHCHSSGCYTLRILIMMNAF